MDFVILMTMMGIISLVGVVVKNGIVLMDFFILLLDKKKAELNLATHEDIPMDQFVTCIVEAGRSRLRPVLLTATTAVLGLIPLAIGLNFNFFTFNLSTFIIINKYFAFIFMKFFTIKTIYKFFSYVFL